MLLRGVFLHTKMNEKSPEQIIPLQHKFEEIKSQRYNDIHPQIRGKSLHVPYVNREAVVGLYKETSLNNVSWDEKSEADYDEDDDEESIQ